jgi:hypothetical protein
MKRSIHWLVSAVVLFASCKGGDNKADTNTPELPEKTDTVVAPVSAPKKPTDTVSTSGQARGITVTDPSAILANLDKHLTTAVQFKPVAGGGFTDCVITVTNTLTDATFQKALVEMSVKRDDGSVIKKDYYTVINIEPGMSKIVKVPNFNLGTSVTAAVVKVKSAELTKGEFVLAGPINP